MKLTHYLYISAVLTLLTACQDDELTSPTYTVGEAINAITLSAGISEGVTGVQTRGAEDHHTTPGHVPFKTDDVTTQLRLRVDGTWLGKGYTNDLVSQTTTATIGDGIKVGSDTENTHNKVSFTSAQQLYWDDYGSADPANMSTAKGGTVSNGTDGRGKGLTIYGVAVEGQDTAPTVSDWKSLAWNVGEPTGSPAAIVQTGGWSAKDLLTSNNIQVVDNDKPYATDGTYKFDDYIDDLKNSTTNSSNLLEFTHAMTKITVNLTAGEGFPGYDTGAANAKFEDAPEVTLLGFNYMGKVNVEGKVSTPTATNGTTGTPATTNIEAWRDGGEDWDAEGQHTSQFTALVFPGNQFADDTDILKLEVDGNTLYVKAKKINDANSETNNTFEQGKNYIFNILYNKTSIVVTATVANWVDVNSEEDKPEININYAYGHEPGTAFTQGFTLYRSTTVTGSYIGTGDKADVTYVPQAGADPVVPAHYTMTPQLYWPTHSTHYFFRGVWPVVDSKDNNEILLGPATSQVKANAVEVANVAYKQGYYPSDLMIGRPLNSDETATDEACKVHSGTQGICATTGDIRMNFRYVMSQVEVELKTVNDPATASVNIDKNTVVEIVNVYNSGNVSMSDGSVSVSGDKGSYTLNVVTGSGNELKRHSAIVPQDLAYTTAGAETNVRFKITVTNNDAVLYANVDEYNTAKGTSLDASAFDALSTADKTKTPATTDIYYADIKPIKEKNKDTLVAPNGKWESGVHYKYELTLSKTEIKVSATIKNWVTVEASENVWF